MLTVLLKLKTADGSHELEGELWNISGLATRSGYDFWFEDRVKVKDDAQLQDYPRWCESTRGLLARCLALTAPSATALGLPDWQEMQVDIGLRPGGRGAVRPLAMACAVHESDGTLSVGYKEAEGPVGHRAGHASRAAYRDVWGLAEHVLRLSLFEADELPAAVALDVPVHKSGNLPYVRFSEIPEPARSVFERRMSHSTRPVIAGAFDAVYAWDWTDFLGGQR